MEIDSLDDLDTSFLPLDYEAAPVLDLWKVLFTDFTKTIPLCRTLIHLGKDSKTAKVARPIFQDDWAAAQNLVAYFWRTTLPRESIHSSAGVITGSVSLRDLLANTYPNLIPFNLPTELPNSPAYTVYPLPEFMLQNITLFSEIFQQATLQALTTPLPNELRIPPAGFLTKPMDWYLQRQADYITNLQTEYYGKLQANLIAKLQAQPPPAPPPVPVAPEPAAISIAVDLDTRSWINEYFQGTSTEPQFFVSGPIFSFEPLTEQIPNPPYKQQFVKLVENKLRENDEFKALAALDSINDFIKKIESKSPAPDNYASLFASQKPISPFREIPLIGLPYQSTIHFHCGINNDVPSIVEGGFCLSDSLDNAYAVQPHLIHAKNIIKGLVLVGLERLNISHQEIEKIGLDEYLPGYAAFPGEYLDGSQIQQSIDYEVANLSQIADAILQNGNPYLKQVHVTFSNGGYIFKEALKQLSPAHRDTIIVITTGTTAIIEKDLAWEVYNVIGNRDWPSKVCNGGQAGIEKAEKEGTVIFLIPQNEVEIGIKGHYFTQPDYQDEISKIIEGLIEPKYEIY